METIHSALVVPIPHLIASRKHTKCVYGQRLAAGPRFTFVGPRVRVQTKALALSSGLVFLPRTLSYSQVGLACSCAQAPQPEIPSRSTLSHQLPLGHTCSCRLGLQTPRAWCIRGCRNGWVCPFGAKDSLP